MVLAAVVAAPAVMLPARLAHADDAAADPDRVRRRLMWAAVALSGGSLLGSLYAHSRYQRDIAMFNNYQAPGQSPNTPDGRCAVNAPGRGGAPCAAILSGANRAHAVFQVSLAVAGAAATTAVLMKLMEPDAPKRPFGSERLALACAPMLGAGGACTLRF